MEFYVGLHQPSDAQHFDQCFISYARLARRKAGFKVRRWILDSGGYSIVERHGCYPEPIEVYARAINKWSWCGELLRAVSRDYMCAPHILAKTGGTVASHQQRTIEELDALRPLVRYTPLMPVIQGWEPADYAAHVRAYGDRLEPEAWVGVGSVAARQEDHELVLEIITAIHGERPDLRLHGFGLKVSSLSRPEIRQALYSADSMVWSSAARWEGRDANSWREAATFDDQIRQLCAA